MNLRNRMLSALKLNEFSIYKNVLNAHGTNVDLKKATGREIAKDIILHALQVTGYWTESDQYNVSKMTQKEKDEVNRQINKFNDRIYTMLRGNN